MALVSPQLMEILVCPVSRGALEEDARGFLICRQSGLAYPVRDGIPIMLPETALKLEDLDKPFVDETSVGR